MFANKSLFDDGDEVDVDDRHNAAYQASRPMTAASSTSKPSFDRAPSASSSTLAGSVAGVGSLEDLPATPTPAMRRAKMEEMRRAQLDKRKTKAMAAPTVMRANEDQVKSSPIASPAAAGPLQPASSPISAASSSRGGPSHSPNPSPRLSSPLSDLRMSPRAGGSGVNLSQRFNNQGDSDEEGEEGAAVDPHMGALLAEKRAARDRNARPMSSAEREMMSQGIAPVFDPVRLPSQPGVKLDFSDMRSFLQQPVPKGLLFQCYILRNKKGLKNKLYPTYECYVSGEERFLFAARKRTKNKTSNYAISMEKEGGGAAAGSSSGGSVSGGSKESASYLGKVRSNFVGTEFVAYDRGLNPKDLADESVQLSMLSVRQELAAVFYESNILGSKGPRKMTAVIPAVRKDGVRAQWKPMRPEESVLTRFKSNPSAGDFMPLTNKTPKWNDQVGAYVLNFNGRVTQASVKNFQLIHVDDPENVLLQFGRIGKDTFTMDLQWPLSPLQAFSICLTSFDYKFACE